MAKALPRLTPSELEIMDSVWNCNESTVTEIMKAVNGNGSKNLSRSTIQVQISRLEEKGWLQCWKKKNKFFYAASVPREDASAEIMDDINQRVFGGSCAELVKSLLGGGKKISSGEIKKIRDLIDKYEAEEL